jgi:hypothetical protein
VAERAALRCEASSLRFYDPAELEEAFDQADVRLFREHPRQHVGVE